MRAVHATAYGPPEVLHLREVPRPEPGPNQLLLRVHAATVTLGDCEVRAFKMVDWIWLPARLAMGVLRPRNPVLGMEVAGEVAAVGSGVTGFAVGDRVFGATGFAFGAWADYARLPATAALAPIPPGLTYAQAAAIPTGGLNGLHFVRQCDICPGERVLINGAGGSIGMFATQLAVAAGGVVTVVDRSEKHDMLRRLGASYAIDYRQTAFWTAPERYDVIIDVVGNTPFAATAAVLADGGRYMLGNPRLAQMLATLRENRRGRIRASFNLAGESRDDLAFLAAETAAGRLRVEIDRSYRLDDIIEANRYVESGAKIGVVTLDVSGMADNR